MRWLITFCFFLVSHSVLAEPQSWMKRNNPDNLGLHVLSDKKCTFQQSQLKKAAQGEFLRARIKDDQSSELFIYVNTLCIRNTTKSGVYTGDIVKYETRFGTIINGVAFLYEYPNYGGLVTAGKDESNYYLDTIKRSVSSAITDYLKANLD